MIFLYQAKLAILSQPKTGTTALDNALGPRASIAVNNPPQLKHMPYRKFMRFVAPWIKAQTGLGRLDYDVVSVMREPVDWLGSWYRYRTRDDLKDTTNTRRRDNYTGEMTFEEFVSEVLKPKEERESFAQVGSPCGIALMPDGSVGCDLVFPYEDLSGLYELIETRTRRPLELQKMNVSPDVDMTLSDGMREKLRAHWQFAFDLHASLKNDGRVAPRFRVSSETAVEDEA
jgi:hypothetical protein